MKIIKGDLIELARNGRFELIVHGANCFNTMNSGIAKQIREQYPQAYEADCKTVKGDKEKLGSYSECMVPGMNDHDFEIINGYTQYNYGYDGNQYVDYEAIRSVFIGIRTHMEKYYPNPDGMRIGYPKIGCGLAGGDWNIVSKIINEELNGFDHTLVEFDR